MKLERLKEIHEKRIKAYEISGAHGRVFDSTLKWGELLPACDYAWELERKNKLKELSDAGIV